MTDKEEIEILQARIDELKGTTSGPPNCFHCGGSGEVAWEGTCYYCNGTGKCYPPNQSKKKIKRDDIDMGEPCW